MVSNLKIAMSQFVVVLLRCVFLLWDIVSFPFFAVVYEPWKAKLLAKRTRARIVKKTGDSVTLQSLDYTSNLREEILQRNAELTTIVELFHYAVKKHQDKPCLGSREVFSEEKEQQDDGKVFTKLLQGEYLWDSYLAVEEKVLEVSRGLVAIGLERQEKVVIYADTRAEWMISALACFQSSATLVTLYTNLGEEGVIFGIGQTRARTIITSQELLPKLGKIIDHVPHLKTIVFFESRVKEECTTTFPAGISLIPFSKLITMGRKTSLPSLPTPHPNDLAIVMYTSGSTGTPKGALLTHGHVAKAITSCLAISCNLLGEDRSDEEAYLAYLPLAHIFELTQEMIVMLMGIRVGYSGPNTLTDSSTMIKKGQQGDASVLRPTAMVAVPVILDRIYKGIQAKVKLRGAFFETLFQMLFQYRLFWTSHGFDTPVLNYLIFSKFRAALGGNIRLIVGGGAPLSSDVHDFLRTCLCVRLAQGYGLTETAGGITLADRDDLSTGKVGHPLPEVRVKLQNWKEGGYTVDDPEGPKGEIVIGCPWVALGYFEMEEMTAENFYEEDGLRWFLTGDIGHILPDGTIRVVDRKKDLVKLQMGEYVSLGKVEASLKVHPMVDNVCVYADSTKNVTIALIVPDEPKLQETAREIFGSNNRSREELCSHPKMINHVLKSLTNYSEHLEKFEIPKGVVLIPELWLPDTGLVTAALKLRRKIIQEHYQGVIDSLYASLEDVQTPKIKVH